MKTLRPLRIEGDIAYVPLGGAGNENTFAIIDARDAELVGKHNWYRFSSRRGGRGGNWKTGERLCPRWPATSNSRRQMVDVYGNVLKVCQVRLHQLFLPPKPGFVIDHIDDDPLNNRRSNLQYLTPRDNLRKSKLNTRNLRSLHAVLSSGRQHRAFDDALWVS